MDIMPRQDRISRIEHELRQPTEFQAVPFRGAQIKAGVIRVPLSLPIYRIQNGRTRVEQLKFIDEHGLPRDFFDGTREEDATVQEAQHSILVRMAKDPKADIYKELATIGEQRGALIATMSGVIVNGNRRLAAMRDLYDAQSDEFPKYGHVDLAILPSTANEHDLEDIETELQEVPETKLDYGWVERRLKMRYQADILNVPRSDLRKKYRLRSDEDITRELAQLALAEEYLAYIGKPVDHYWDVSQAEEIFKRLQAALSKYADDEAEVRRLIGFALIKSSAERVIRDRVYKFHTIFGDDFDKVIDRYVEQYQETDENDGAQPLQSRVHRGPTASPADDLMQSFAPAEDGRLDGLRDALRNPDGASIVAKELVGLYRSIEDEEDEEDVRRAALTSVSHANRLLQEVSLDGADPQIFGAVRAQLESAGVAIQRIRDQLDSLANAK